MKHYIIVGDNNYWYAYFEANNDKEINTQLTAVKIGIVEGSFAGQSAAPTVLRMFEVNPDCKRFGLKPAAPKPQE